MAVPEGFVELRKGPAFGWVAAELAELGLDPFWGELAPIDGAKGRGGIGVLELAGRTMVVRPCRRGGAFGPLLQDRYASTRRVRGEIDTLTALRAAGVPVVVPLAAVARRHGAFWRLRLCTERQEGAEPLPAFMAAHPELRRITADAIGTLLRLAFAAGLRHPDLHPDNVLCAKSGDRVRAVLVDLDRARVKAPIEQREADVMLVRMVRYVARHHNKLAAVPTRTEQMRFLRGLGLERSERKVTFQRLAEKLRRSLGRRRWLGR